MLYDYYKYFLNYLVCLYGGSYEVKGHLLFMYSGNDIFKVSLLDGSRFDKFTFYHKNHVPYDGHFHKHMSCKDLEFGIFRCFTHSFNTEFDIPYDKENWHRFEKDALKYKLLNIEGD